MPPASFSLRCSLGKASFEVRFRLPTSQMHFSWFRNASFQVRFYLPTSKMPHIHFPSSSFLLHFSLPFSSPRPHFVPFVFTFVSMIRSLFNVSLRFLSNMQMRRVTTTRNHPYWMGRGGSKCTTHISERGDT